MKTLNAVVRHIASLGDEFINDRYNDAAKVGSITINFHTDNDHCDITAKENINGHMLMGVLIRSCFVLDVLAKALVEHMADQKKETVQ